MLSNICVNNSGACMVSIDVYSILLNVVILALYGHILVYCMFAIHVQFLEFSNTSLQEKLIHVFWFKKFISKSKVAMTKGVHDIVYMIQEHC